MTLTLTLTMALTLTVTLTLTRREHLSPSTFPVDWRDLDEKLRWRQMEAIGPLRNGHPKDPYAAALPESGRIRSAGCLLYPNPNPTRKPSPPRSPAGL